MFRELVRLTVSRLKVERVKKECFDGMIRPKDLSVGKPGESTMLETINSRLAARKDRTAAPILLVYENSD